MKKMQVSVQRKSRDRGKVTGKCGLLVGIGYNRMDERGEAFKNIDEDRSKSTQIGILCTRD